MSDHEPNYDDRCDDEQREADISRAHSADCMESYGVPYDPYADGDEEEVEETAPPANANVRRERTPEEDAEWLEDKRAEYEADRICGHHWSNC
jgi:hypothetical protein